MALFESQKLQKDGCPPRRLEKFLHILPYLNACAIILILMLIFNNSQQRSPVQIRVPQELAQTSASVQTIQEDHGLQFHHNEPASDGVDSTYACDSPSSRGHVKLMEHLLDPHGFLKELVKQEGHTWLQIGSNTMDNMNGNDPLKRLLNLIPTWQKVFVEPIPQLFAKLEKSIERWPNSTAVNLAISPDRETVETKAQMWCYGAAFESHRLGKDLPSWANQICSFNASHIGRHFKGQQGVPVEVTAVNLEELLRRTTGAGSLTNLQVLLIDTEGFDYAVLKQIPFAKMRPAFILWEHKHLYGSRTKAEELLRSHCYAVKVLDMENTVALSLLP